MLNIVFLFPVLLLLKGLMILKLQEVEVVQTLAILLGLLQFQTKIFLVEVEALQIVAVAQTKETEIGIEIIPQVAKIRVLTRTAIMIMRERKKGIGKRKRKRKKRKSRKRNKTDH